MNEKREMLRHFLAALAYRVQKTLRDAPEGFETFSPGNQVRTPHELLCHITSVLGYARTFFIGGFYPRPVPLELTRDIATFHDILADLSRHLSHNSPLDGTDEERLLQGPFADAMAHAGQLAMLPRLYGSPIPPENFIVADISKEKLGPDQSPPVSPDDDWPERPS